MRGGEAGALEEHLDVTSPLCGLTFIPLIHSTRESGETNPGWLK